MAGGTCGAGQRHAEESEQEGSGELRRTEAALRQALQQSETDRARLRTQHASLSRRHDATKQELEERTESAAHLLRELEASLYQVSGGTLRETFSVRGSSKEQSRGEGQLLHDARRTNDRLHLQLHGFSV